MDNNLHIVVLAAGLSQRLGFAKQLILKDNITLLEEKIRLAFAFSNNVTVVIPKIDTDWAKQICCIARRFPIQLVSNPTPQLGMAHSIQLATAALCAQNLPSTARVMFLTIDQIALNNTHLVQLTQAVPDTTLIASRYATPAVVGIPVNMPVGFLTAFVPQLEGDKGFGKILAHLAQADSTYRILTIDLPELAWDIDTPEQFEQLKKAFALTPYLAQ